MPGRVTVEFGIMAVRDGTVVSLSVTKSQRGHVDIVRIRWRSQRGIDFVVLVTCAAALASGRTAIPEVAAGGSRIMGTSFVGRRTSVSRAGLCHSP